MIDELLSEENIKKRGLFRPEEVKRVIESESGGKRRLQPAGLSIAESGVVAASVHGPLARLVETQVVQSSTFRLRVKSKLKLEL